MAERVGDVRDARGPPELARAPEPLLKIADYRSAGDEEEVRQDMPRPDEGPVGSDERFDSREIGGPFLEIVLDRDGLSIERERAKVRVAFEDVQEARHHRNEAGAVSLEPLVPLAVPVRVRDHERAPTEAPPDERDRTRCEETEDDADGDAAKHVERVVNADDDAGERAGDPEQQNGHAIAR